MATESEPEIWEDLEKLNLNGLKPAPTTIIACKPVQSIETEHLQVSLEDVDDALLEALKDTKERSTVIEYEDKVECFIKDASLDVLEFPHTQSTYHRKLAHRVAQHYGLSTSTVEHDDGQVHVVARRSTRVGHQARLSTLEVRANGSAACPAGSTGTLPVGDPPRLLVRPGGADTSNSNGNGDGDAAAAPVRSAKERQEDYMRDKERLLGQAASTAAATASSTGGEPAERSNVRGPVPGGRGSSGQQGAISQGTGRHMGGGGGGGGGGRYGAGGRGHYMNGGSSIGMMGGREDGGGGRGANKRSTPKDKASELQDPDYHRGIERFNGTARFDPSYSMGPGAMGMAGHMGPQGIYHVPTYMNEFPTLGPQHQNGPRGFRQDPNFQQHQQQQQWSSGPPQHNGAGPGGRGNNGNFSRQAPPGPSPPPGGPHSSPPPPPPPSNNGSSPNGNNNQNNGRHTRDGHSPTRSTTRSAKSQHSLQGGGSNNQNNQNNNHNSSNNGTMKGPRGFNNNNMPPHGSAAPVLPLQPYPYMPGGMQVAYSSPPNGMYPYPYPMQQYGPPMGVSMSPTAAGYPNMMFAPFPPGGAAPPMFNAQTAAAMGLYPIQPGFTPFQGHYDNFAPQLQHQGQGYEYAYPQQQFQQPQQHMHFQQQQAQGMGYRTSGSGSAHA